MPIPLDILRAAQAASILLEGEELSAGLHGHPRLLPRAYVISATRPLGAASGPEDAKRHSLLQASLKQNGLMTHPLTLRWLGGEQDAVLALGCSRARAVKLAYKRKQWCVWMLEARGMQVVYSGVNSRSK